MVYTLITGATGFIGREFAVQCHNKGENLILTGRNEYKLAELKRELSESCGEVLICACDLTGEIQREKFFAFIGDRKIAKLINVAGADIQKPFEEYSRQKAAFQIRINFEAAVCCTAFALSSRAEKLQVINVSSMCGITPMPYFALYSAAKGALTSFSRALGVEMRGKGVTVTAVLPGSVYTREDVCKYIENLGAWGRFAAKYPRDVVKSALSAADRGKSAVIVGGANRLVAALSRLVPLRFRLKFIAHRWADSRKDAF